MLKRSRRPDGSHAGTRWRLLLWLLAAFAGLDFLPGSSDVFGRPATQTREDVGQQPSGREIGRDLAQPVTEVPPAGFGDDVGSDFAWLSEPDARHDGAAASGGDGVDETVPHWTDHAFAPAAPSLSLFASQVRPLPRSAAFRPRAPPLSA